MFPGMGGRLDPRRMNQMMRQLGIDVQDVEDVEQVTIRTKTKDIVFDKADVTIMIAQGQKTYQVVGSPRTVPRAGTAAPGAPASHAPPAAPVPVKISEDDVKLVAEQSGKSVSEARKALEATQGDIAEAIVRLTG